MSGRIFKIKRFGEVSTHKSIGASVPQGSLLGPELLFCSPRVFHVSRTPTSQFMRMTSQLYDLENQVAELYGGCTTDTYL